MEANIRNGYGLESTLVGYYEAYQLSTLPAFAPAFDLVLAGVAYHILEISNRRCPFWKCPTARRPLG